MLWTIAVVLAILWLLGLMSGYTPGNFIYILLVIAIIIVLVIIIQGKLTNSVDGTVTFIKVGAMEREPI